MENLNRSRKKILSEDSRKKTEDDWDDDIPTWAESASKVSGINIIENSENKISSVAPRKGPAIFGFKKASDYEVEEVEVPDSPAMVYSATSLGLRISRLYLNPVSGKIKGRIRQCNEDLNRIGQYETDFTIQLITFSYMHTRFHSVMATKKDFPKIQDAIYGHEKELLTESVDLEDEGRMKGALVLQEWTEETSINEFEKEWNVQPGDLRSRVDLAEWLLFSTRAILMDDEELSGMDTKSHRLLFEAVDETHRRVRYGCKSDLISLVSLRGIGRVRAREMVEKLGVSNVRDVAMLTENDKIKLSELRGWSMKLVDRIVKNALQKSHH